MFIDTERTEPTRYEIQVSGRLSPERSAWFEDMTLTVEHTMGGETCTRLSGLLADQSALFGILTRIRDLGLTLISLNSSEPGIDHRKNKESYLESQNEYEPVAQEE